MFHTETNAFTFPLTHGFLKDFSGLDNLALDLQFATDKTLTARKGPTPVFTRASGATQVGASGLIEFAPENLLLQSEGFSTASWQKSGSTIMADSIVSPSGSLTADLFNEDSGLSAHITQQSAPSLIAGQSYSFSVFAKAGSHTSFQMALSNTAFGGGLFANFVLTGSGSVGTSSGLTTSIQSYPDGWYRCSITIASVVGGSGGFATIVANANNSSAARLPSYQGTGTQVVYLWGAQLEAHPTARTYIPTTTAAVYGARFDHDPITLACKGLLIEESRTNSILQSEAFSSTSWANGVVTRTADQIASPSGATTADLITSVTGNFGGKLAQNFTFATTTYTASIFVKKGNWRYIGIQLADVSSSAVIPSFDFDTETVSQNGTSYATIGFQKYGNGWYRITLTQAVTAINSTFAIWMTASNGNVTGPIGAGNTVYVWGAQLEAGAFPTSYIPTTTASVVRSVDICSIAAGPFATFYNPAGGTLATTQTVNTVSTIATPEACRIVGSVGQLQFGATNLANEALRFFSVGSVARSLRTGTRASGVQFKTAIAFANNDLAACLDNGSVLTDTTTQNIPIGVSMTIGFNAGCMHIARLQYFKKRLANAKLQAITA